MIKLTDEQKEFLSRALGDGATPMEAAASFERQFGRPISRQAAAAYDPTTVAGKRLRKRYQDIYWLARQELLDRAEQRHRRWLERGRGRGQRGGPDAI